jgi:drug/metabolite transporter (DMT)-like permease
MIDDRAQKSAVPVKNVRSRIATQEPSSAVWSVLFVLLYGSGFVIGKFGVIDTGPFSFLLGRFIASAAVFAAICWIVGRPLYLDWHAIPRLALAGGFSLFGFSGFAFSALKFGINPALLSVIVALQPIVVAVLASLRLGERITAFSWIGLFAGFFGVYLIVSERVFEDRMFAVAIILSFLAMMSLSLGSFFQKRYCEVIDIFYGGVIQNVVSALLCVPVILYVEGLRFEATTRTIGALIWMVFVVSVGAVSILYRLMKAREVSKVTSLFFLTPIVAFFLSRLLFGGELTAEQIIGVAVVCAGVFAVNAGPRSQASAGQASVGGEGNAGGKPPPPPRDVAGEGARLSKPAVGG